MRTLKLLWQFTLLLCIASATLASDAKKQNKLTNTADFITVQGTQFFQHNKPYYIVGTNMWYGGYLGSATKAGDRARLSKELDSLQAMGINNIRVLAVSEKSELNSSVHPATTNSR